MAVLTECSSVNIACLYPSALAMLRPIGVCRLYCPVPPTMLTKQRCHIFEVGLAPIVGVLGEHHHICFLVGVSHAAGLVATDGSTTEPNRLHQHLYATSIPFEKLTPKKPAANLCTELQSHNLQHQTTKSNGRECHRVHRRTSNIRPI